MNEIQKNHLNIDNNISNNIKQDRSLNEQYSKKENSALVEMYAEIVSVIVNDYFEYF